MSSRKRNVEQSTHTQLVEAPFDNSQSLQNLVLSHSTPVHIANISSPLSKESAEQNYRGFLNLAILLLFVSNIRLVFENYVKYGLLLSVPGEYVIASDWGYMTLDLFLSAVALLLSFGIEKLSVRKVLKHGMCMRLGILNSLFVVCHSCVVIWYLIESPLVGSFVLFNSIILCMKLASYHLVNAEIKAKKTDANLYPQLPYPKNITLGNLCYFWLVPTLCYQPCYPSTPKFKVSFFIKRVIEFLSTLSMVYFLMEQYLLPTVKNSIKPMDDWNVTMIIERIMKLSVSSLYIWLLMFYCFFHAFLNATAELTQFGDRLFYREWWNVNSIEEYWRLWNLPVHNWFKRHIYRPLRLHGFSVSQTTFLIFFLSAVFHEVLVAVPTRIVQFWAFFGMILQIPLIVINKWYLKRRPNSSFGNFFFWISFCMVGQPMCVLLYYRAWVKSQ